MLLRDVGCAVVFGLNVIGFRARFVNRMFAVILPNLCCMLVARLAGVLSVTSFGLIYFDPVDTIPS